MSVVRFDTNVDCVGYAGPAAHLPYHVTLRPRTHATLRLLPMQAEPAARRLPPGASRPTQERRAVAPETSMTSKPLRSQAQP